MQKLFLLLACLFVTGCAYEAGYGYRYSAYPVYTQSYYAPGYGPTYGHPGYSPHYNHNPHYNPPPSIVVRPNNQHGRTPPPKWHH